MSISFHQPHDKSDAEPLRPEPLAHEAPRPPLPPLTAADLVTPDGTLPCDLPCAGCGYNLRTLALSGRCPECGLGVQAALAPQRLYLHDPAVLRWLDDGLLVASLGVSALVPVLAAAVWASEAPFTSLMFMTTIRWLLVFSLGGFLIALLGMFMFTGPDLPPAAPRATVDAADDVTTEPADEGASGWNYRRLARASGAAAVGLAIAAPVLTILAPSDLDNAGLSLAVLWVLAVSVSGTSALGYLELLLARVPGEPGAVLARLARLLVVWGVVGLLVTLVSLKYGLPFVPDDVVRPWLGRLTAAALLAALILAAVTAWRAWLAVRRTVRIAAALRSSLTKPLDTPRSQGANS